MSCLTLMLAISMHIGLEGNYNTIHPHARCQKNTLISGIYYNSEEKISAYVGVEKKGLEVRTCNRIYLQRYCTYDKVQKK